MGSPIPNTSFRYIQQEETTNKASFSENLVQGIGGDLNYINGQINAISTLLSNFYANAGLSIAQIFIAEGTGQTSQTSPNGGDIYMAFMTPNFNGSPEGPVMAVMPGNQLSYCVGPGIGGGSGPQAKIQGPTVFVNGFGHEWYGYMIYAS